MFKKCLFILITILTIFMLTGCIESKVGTSTNEHANVDSEESQKGFGSENKSNKNQERTESNQFFSGSLKSPLMTVHYIDVGQGDSTLIHFLQDKEEFTILIDAGNFNSTNVISYLKSQKIDQIDLAIGTHPDADHIGQLDQVINTFNVGEVWLPGNMSTSQTFQEVLRAIDSTNIGYHEPRMGEAYEIGPLEVKVLYPKKITGDTNEESISIKLTYGQVRFVFTGDAAQSNEIEMVNSGVDLSAEILHLGHHGSNTSTSPAFLKAVHPEIAVYSAGKNNTYGHPHSEVVNLVQNSGIKLYGTDVHGTIIIATDGVNYEIATKENGTITPSSETKQPVINPTTSETKETSNSSDINRNCVNINTSSIEQLEEIIHIGSERAQDLIELRPFGSIDDLSRIDGIGPARVADIKIQGLACIGG